MMVEITVVEITIHFETNYDPIGRTYEYRT